MYAGIEAALELTPHCAAWILARAFPFLTYYSQTHLSAMSHWGVAG